MGGCDDALLIYGAPKSSTFYVVKWPFLGLQQAPENSVLAPSSRDLLAIICHNDELSSSLTWIEIVYNSVFW